MDIFIPATPFERQLPSSPAVQEQPVASPPPVTPPKKRPPLLLFIVIILVLTLPVGVYLFQKQQQEAEAPFQGVAYPGLGVAGAGGANQSLGGALPTNLGGGVVHVGTDGVPVASVFQNSKGGYTVFKGSSPQPSTKTLADITTPDSGKSAGMITNLDKFTSGVEAAIIFDAGNSKLAIVDNSIGVDKTNYTGKPTKTVDLTILSSKTTLVPADLTRKVNVTYDKDTNPNTCATGCTGNSPLSSTQMSLGDALSEIARGNLTGTFQLDFVDSPGSWLSFQIKGGGSSGGGTNTGGSDTPPTKIPTPSSAHTSTPTPTTTMTPTPTHTPTPTPTTTLTGTPTHTPTGTISPTITPTTVIGNTGTPAPTLSYTPKTPVSGNESIWGVAAAIGGALLLLVGFAL